MLRSVRVGLLALRKFALGCWGTLRREPVGVIALVFTVWQLNLYMNELTEQRVIRKEEKALRERTLNEMDADRALREATLFVMLSERLQIARSEPLPRAMTLPGPAWARMRPHVDVMRLLERMVDLGISLQDLNVGAVRMQEANLPGADLSRAHLVRANLRRANLNGADFHSANLAYASLASAELIDADFTSADLTVVELTKANLIGSKFQGADLTGASLRDADLSNAILKEADLRQANLEGADLKGVNLTDTNLWNADLSDVRNLTQLQLDRACVVSPGVAPVSVPPSADPTLAGSPLNISASLTWSGRHCPD